MPSLISWRKFGLWLSVPVWLTLLTNLIQRFPARWKSNFDLWKYHIPIFARVQQDAGTSQCIIDFLGQTSRARHPGGLENGQLNSRHGSSGIDQREQEALRPDPELKKVLESLLWGYFPVTRGSKTSTCSTGFNKSRSWMDAGHTFPIASPNLPGHCKR
jgi:hypothetical protein